MTVKENKTAPAILKSKCINFRVHPTLIERMKMYESLKGVKPTEQLRNAIDEYLAKKGM